jgi:hypothetical protein
LPRCKHDERFDLFGRQSFRLDVHDRLGPFSELTLIRSIVAGELSIQSLAAKDFERTVDVMKRYPVTGFVDASVVAVAERLRLRTIATTDRRHIGKVRPSHVKAFDLVP